MRHLPVLTVLMLGFAGCMKDPLGLHRPKFDGVSCSGSCFTLSGRLIDTPSGNPMQGVKLKFTFKKSHAWLSAFLGVSTTDADGRYSFRFPAADFVNEKGYYRISYEKTGVMHDNQYGNDLGLFHLDSSHINVPFVQNFSMVHQSVLNLRVKVAKEISQKGISVSHGFGRGRNVYFLGHGPVDTVYRFITACDLRTAIQIDAWATNKSDNKILLDTVTVRAGPEWYYLVELK